VDKMELICKSCVYHAGLQLPGAYSWLEVCRGVQSPSVLGCMVCHDEECGPWIQVTYLELASDREG